MCYRPDHPELDDPTLLPAIVDPAAPMTRAEWWVLVAVLIAVPAAAIVAAWLIWRT